MAGYPIPRSIQSVSETPSRPQSKETGRLYHRDSRQCGASPNFLRRLNICFSRGQVMHLMRKKTNRIIGKNQIISELSSLPITAATEPTPKIPPMMSMMIWNWAKGNLVPQVVHARQTTRPSLNAGSPHRSHSFLKKWGVTRDFRLRVFGLGPWRCLLPRLSRRLRRRSLRSE